MADSSIKPGDFVYYSINFAALTELMGLGIVIEGPLQRGPEDFSEAIIVYWFKHRRKERLSRFWVDKVKEIE